MFTVFTGIIFRENPSKTGFVYACNLLGAGLGGILLYTYSRFLLPDHLFFIIVVLTLIGTIFLFYGILSFYKAALFLVIASLPIILTLTGPFSAQYNEFKDISRVRALPNSKTTFQKPTRFGLLEVVEAESFHDLPDLILDQ